MWARLLQNCSWKGLNLRFRATSRSAMREASKQVHACVLAVPCIGKITSGLQQRRVSTQTGPLLDQIWDGAQLRLSPWHRVLHLPVVLCAIWIALWLQPRGVGIEFSHPLQNLLWTGSYLAYKGGRNVLVSQQISEGSTPRLWQRGAGAMTGLPQDLCGTESGKSGEW